MPSFLKEFRRKSKSHSKPSSTHDSSSSSETNGSGQQDVPPNEHIQHNKSSSSLGSFFARPDNGESPPVKTRSNTNLSGMTGSKTPPLSGDKRPNLQGAQANRYSLAGSPLSNGAPRAMTYTSPSAPRVLSISDSSWVHQKILLISGTAGDIQQPTDGHVVICHHQDTFPPMNWPVSDGHFKAIVHLLPGPNRLRLDFIQQRRPSNGNSGVAHSSWININYLPLVHSPPLHLVILVAKDSPRTFDAMPDRVRTEGNGLETAKRKYRMAAYLWEAFTGEQMNRNQFGRRCFRLEEEWQPGTLTNRDLETGQMRNEAKIHVVTVNKTIAEIRDLDVAQQYGPAKRKGDLFSYAMETVKGYFNHQPGQKQYVSCLYLDTHWDPQVGTIRGHAALGGGGDGMQLAICGSQALQSYPAHIEEVVPAFSDCTRTDTAYVANDLNESGSSWEAANIGIGAHMHEVGHLFGCPHQENGVMQRGYVTLNRTFTTREPFSTRTKSPGLRLCQTTDECFWHRLDILRFRFHPCFQLPTDPAPAAEDSVQVWAVDNGIALVTSQTGVAWIEIYTEGDEQCHHWIEYIDNTRDPVSPRQVSLTEDDLRSRVGNDKKGKKLSLKVFSTSGGEHEVKDFGQLVSKSSRIKLPDGRTGYRGSKLGFSQMQNSQPQDVVFESFHIKTKLMTNVKIYHGFALDGIEFIYEDGETQLFGKRGGKPGGEDFILDVRRGEHILGFYLRAGLWIDGLQILTSNGRRSEIYGNKNGGSGTTLIPPRGYSIAGIYGSCGDWLDGFGLIVSR